jgi:hypothetical protein
MLSLLAVVRRVAKPPAQLGWQLARHHDPVHRDEIAFRKLGLRHRLARLELVPVAAPGDRHADLAAVLGDRNIGDADLLGQPLHRLQPYQIVKLRACENDRHDTLPEISPFRRADRTRKA